MARLTVNDIEIDMGLTIRVLHSFYINTRVNCHGYMRCTGILYPESGREANTHTLSNRRVAVSIGGQPVLAAIVQKLEIRQENEVYHFSLYATTSSVLLDFKPLNYFYQNARQTWAEMVRKAIRRGEGSCIATTGKERIRIPILQYRETPWEFARRMAAQISTVITVDSLSESPGICLGIPNGTNRVVDKERLVRDYGVLASRRDVLLREDAAKFHDTYYIEDERIFRLGDVVDTGTTCKPIVSIEHILNGDILENHYTIADATAVLEEPWENEKQAGLMLDGTVIAVAADQVKVCLHIPDDAENERATWFDYAPVTNNGMYAMPPVGTGAALQWMSSERGDCKAVRVVRDGTALPSTYEHRSFITEHHRHLHMGPNFLSFLSGGNRLIMRKGIWIRTKKRIRLTAGKDIEIAAEKSLSVKSPEEVFITRTGIISNVWMKAREIHVKSADTFIRNNGTGALLPTPRRKFLKSVKVKSSTLAVLLGALPKQAGTKSK